VADEGELLVVYGRQPVLEALADPRVAVEEVLVSRRGVGSVAVDAVVAAAAERGVALRRVAPEKVTRVSGNGRHDQGVVALVRATGVVALDSAGRMLDGPVLVLDGVTNPANVGMIIRTAAAFGVGVVLPRAGSPDVGPLVIKASAGVALFAPLRQADTAVAAVRLLRAAGFRVLGLAADGAGSLWSAAALDGPGQKLAFVLGNETSGLSDAVAAEVDGTVAIPLGGGVESLNVAVAAGVVCAELARRGPYT
jgi:23S rRNA (guanosine2251-2'-O)-methyltransferase